MTEKQARNAFLKPAALSGDFSSPEFTYSKSATNAVFEYLKDKNQLIEPFQLQLLGQHAEERINSKRKNTERKAKLSRQNKEQEKTKYELGIKDLGKPDAIFKKTLSKSHFEFTFGKTIQGSQFSRKGPHNQRAACAYARSGNYFAVQGRQENP